MEFELFTVSIKQDGTVGMHFSPKLLQITTEKELLKSMDGKMEGILQTAEILIAFLQAKALEKANKKQ